jgi:demethylmenaquinone methyltransferase / 2-methoxy-6-polyprenyl-1,4-benzoquinol methylase
MHNNPAPDAPSAPHEAAAETDFGYRRVAKTEKASLVRAVFESVAPRYDVMNDLMSLGIHRAWKRRFLTRLAPSPRRCLLDLAGGTGDITFLWREAGGGPAILSDINPAMVEVARRRALDRGLVRDIEFLVADAEHLPLPDASQDVVSMAFGLRNCTDKAAVLAEAHRVLRRGGRFLCLEFSRLRVAALRPAYDAWSFRALPWIGGRVASDAESYQYLSESIRMFPDQETLAGMLRAAGFARVGVENLTGGIAAIHSGWKL